MSRWMVIALLLVLAAGAGAGASGLVGLFDGGGGAQPRPARGAS